MSLELEQAQNEIAALQRRLTEYAAEVERLRTDHALYVEETDAYWKRTVEAAKAENERLRAKVDDKAQECYVEADDKSTLNALEACRQERDKLKEGAKPVFWQIKDGWESLMIEASEFIHLGEDGDPECNCCGMCLEKDGKGHKRTCLANLILENQINHAFTKARELGLLEDK